MKLEMDLRGVPETTRLLLDLPGKFQKSKKSAMGSIGWQVMNELRNHLEYGPPEWQGLHALTARFRKNRRSAGKGRWIMRQMAPKSPAAWLGRFARYRLSRSGNTLQIDFGKGKRGKNPGRLDPKLSQVARRIDGGEKIPVTDKMRKKWAATWYRAAQKKKDPVAGVDWFPLRKSTTVIDIPARPIFAPVLRKIRPKVGPFFEKRFWESYHGVDKFKRTVWGQAS